MQPGLLSVSVLEVSQYKNWLLGRSRDFSILTDLVICSNSWRNKINLMSLFTYIPTKDPLIKMFTSSATRTKSMFSILHTCCNVDYHFRDIYCILLPANLNYKHRYIKEF
jgi:hypothetical protein